MEYNLSQPLFNPETRELNIGILPKIPLLLLMLLAMTSLFIAYYASISYYYMALTLVIALTIQKPVLRRIDPTVETAFKLCGLFGVLHLLGIPFLLFF